MITIQKFLIGKDDEGNWLIDLEKLNEVINVEKNSSIIYEGHVSHFWKILEWLLF